MKRYIVGVWLLCMCVAHLCAQSPKEKGLSCINRAKAEAYIHFLASDELRGREAGTPDAFVASAYIASCLQLIGVQPLLDGYYQPFDAYRRERQRRGRLQVHPDSIRVLRQEVHQRYPMRNVLGMIPGERADEYVVVGAHFDHLGVDCFLEGDAIYNGADDNASGVQAVLQIAQAFVASGKKPLRTVIFAFWDGEEKGLLGSSYFVQNFSQLDKVKGYLNFDMIGRNNKPEQPQHVVYFYTAAHPAFGEWLEKDIRKYGLELQPDYRAWECPDSGSDNAVFAVRGVPVIWYHTDGHPDYHLPSDEPALLNWEKMVDITKASYLNVWNLANEKEY